MYLIQQVTDDSYQIQTLNLQDGTQIVLSIRFRPMQFGWFIDNITYGTFQLNNIRICNSPNILHQYRNQIPFGLACFSTDDREPTQQEDFSSGASILYILSADEVVQYARFLSGQV